MATIWELAEEFEVADGEPARFSSELDQQHTLVELGRRMAHIVHRDDQVGESIYDDEDEG